MSEPPEQDPGASSAGSRGDNPDADQVPDGAAVFPEIPAELGVNPLLLATLHATVFLAGSDEAIVNPEAADEALGALAGYLQRLQGRQLEQVREDLLCLTSFARQQKWPKQLVRYLKEFLKEFGIGSGGEEKA